MLGHGWKDSVSYPPNDPGELANRNVTLLAIVS